jgi:hypothetical protein
MLRALTLVQPWAWAIAHADKRVENRTWLPPRALVGAYLAIHAGKGFDKHAQWKLVQHGYEPPALHVHGAIVAVARVKGTVRERDPNVHDDPWFCGPIGWQLDEVRTFAEPVPCRGAQGLWTVPDDVLAVVRARWRNAA